MADKEVPDRCRRCAHWMGRFSGDEDDTRCNRRWGHDPAYGDFAGVDEDGTPFAQPAEVTKDCKVRRWGPPIPPVDDNGYAAGEAPEPQLVDAFTPVKPRRGQGIRRSVPIRLKTDRGTIEANAQDIRTYLMANDEKDLEELFEEREERRTQQHEDDRRSYEDMFGVSQSVVDGIGQLTAWEKGTEKMPTGVPQLDMALAGGIEPGTRINISGREDAGKTTLKNLFEGAILKYYVGNSPAPDSERIARIVPEGNTISYMLRAMNVQRFAAGLGYAGKRDVPPKFDEVAAAFNFANQHVQRPNTTFQEESLQKIVSSVTDDIQEFGGRREPDMKSYNLPVAIRAFSIDSIDAESLAEEHFKSKKDTTETKLGEENRVATQARLLAEAFRKMYKAKKVPVTLIMISQQRASGIGTGFSSKSETRGNAHPYFIDLGLSLWSNKFDPSTDDFKKVHVNFKKVHCDADIVPGEEIVLYLTPHHGFRPDLNAIKYALEREDVSVLERSGSWVYYEPDTDEEIKRQGTNPADIARWLEDQGRLAGLYPKIMQELGLRGSGDDDDE